MSGLNKVMLIGRLGQDPEMRHTQNGDPVANMGLATNETWNDKNGDKQERTEWHRIVVFGKLAELVGKYLTKGREAYVEGRLQTRQWDDRDGNKRSTTEVVARDIVFLGGKGEYRGGGNAGNDGGDGDRQAGGQGSGGRRGGGQQGGDGPDYGAPADDDYPF